MNKPMLNRWLIMGLKGVTLTMFIGIDKTTMSHFHPINDLDLVIASLNVLCPNVYKLSTSICNINTPLHFDELFDKFVDFENYLQRDE
ncbi:hypothetical protein CR513_12790, partial [Mucuna pruriens]